MVQSFCLVPLGVGINPQFYWNGDNYSSRIWKHSQEFTDQVQETVVKGLMTGQSRTKMASELMEYTDSTRYVAERLVRTETAHFLAEGQKEAYVAAGIEKYRYLAALSERTCEVCTELDNKVFPLDEATEGVNYPPMHPNCRCVTITADAKLSTRLARDPVTGENYKVDGNMTFAEWKESLSDEQKQAFNIHVRQNKNKSADKKQYAKYVKRLGAENMPKTFDKFQDLKYNDVKTWELMKDYYKSRGTNMISAFTTFEDYVTYKKKIEDELVGVVTVDGVEIKAQSKHFIERIFGTTKDPKTDRHRSGVEIADIKEALLNGDVRKRGDSTKYITNNCIVSVNPVKKMLIQTNPQ